MGAFATGEAGIFSTGVLVRFVVFAFEPLLVFRFLVCFAVGAWGAAGALAATCEMPATLGALRASAFGIAGLEALFRAF